MRAFTLEEYRMLAVVEREMDNGKQPHVVNKGDRWAVSRDIMDELCLVSGQGVSDCLITKILEARMANLTQTKH